MPLTVTTRYSPLVRSADKVPLRIGVVSDVVCPVIAAVVVGMLVSTRSTKSSESVVFPAVSVTRST
ncbi:hypothetical protein D3C81_1315980 [compost metagenome]